MTQKKKAVRKRGTTPPWTSWEAVAVAVLNARLGYGITQGQLAAMANLPQHVISRLENGKHNVRLDTLNKVAMVLNMMVALEKPALPPATDTGKFAPVEATSV